MYTEKVGCKDDGDCHVAPFEAAAAARLVESKPHFSSFSTSGMTSGGYRTSAGSCHTSGTTSGGCRTSTGARNSVPLVAVHTFPAGHIASIRADD